MQDYSVPTTQVALCPRCMLSHMPPANRVAAQTRLVLESWFLLYTSRPDFLSHPGNSNYWQDLCTEYRSDLAQSNIDQSFHIKQTKGWWYKSFLGFIPKFRHQTYSFYKLYRTLDHLPIQRNKKVEAQPRPPHPSEPTNSPKSYTTCSKK